MANPDPAATKIRIRDLGKDFVLRGGRTVRALDGIALDIADGEFVSILGASGCGKTTLLRIVGDLDFPSTGAVEIETRGAARPTATVFQESSVFPWLTVRRNVEYGLRIRGVARTVRREIADRFIAKVGLTAFRDAYPAQLSGGMKQRVSVARAFANGPEVLLMDEPFGALDEQTRIVMQQELLRLWNEDRRTILFVTHSLDEAIALSDRVVVLTVRPGRIKEIVPIDLPRPRDVTGLRSDPRYGALYQRLWALVQADIESGRTGEAA